MPGNSEHNSRENTIWLSFMERTPEMDEEIKTFIEQEREELAKDFCRGCGYCMPCPEDIQINCA